MANLLGSITPFTTAITALSNLLLVSPQKTIGYQPQNAPNADGSPSTSSLPPALLFNYEGEQAVSLESDITDHYVEDNTAISDQIALKPETITTHGFIGELNDVAPSLLAPVQAIANRLVTIGAYTPSLSITALNAYNTAFQLYQIAQNAKHTIVSGLASLSGSGGESVITGAGISVEANQNKQQTYFQQFYGYWKSKTLFTVQTPWAVFQNMAIKSFRAIQDADTDVITGFEITFKIIRTASTLTTLQASLGAGRFSSQAASLIGSGLQTPPPSLGVDTALGNSYPGSFTGIPA